VFVRNQAIGDTPQAAEGTFFRCPECKEPLAPAQDEIFTCQCGLRWGIQDGIYNFKDPLTSFS
jgi:hypothetical protein